MVSKFQPISISLSPNVQKDDVVLALKLLFQPWRWIARHNTAPGSAITSLEDNFKKYIGVKYAFSFNSGRSSLYAILLALNLPKGSNVLMQAFTCNAVVNPILWAGLNPIYIDVADDFNAESYKVRKVNKVHKVRIVQHTFGLPANTDKIHNEEIIIEDCAHALGAEINGRKVGTFGDVAFFSFSRDKVISSVYGGMAVTNNPEIAKKLELLQKKFGQPGYFWIAQQILHPILLYFIILPLYNVIDLGKIFLVASQWLHLLSKAVSWQEKRGLKPDYFPKALSNALALMAQHQFNKLETFNNHRKEIAEFYYKELSSFAKASADKAKFGLPVKENNIFLRFAITHPRAHEILYEAWHKENILLGDWYTSVIAPEDTQLDTMKYEMGMCKNAEKLSKQTLNLPTHINISLKEAQKIVDFLRKYT